MLYAVPSGTAAERGEEAGKANRELVTAMSHDLHSSDVPVRLCGHASRWRRGRPGKQQRKYLNSIQDKAYQIKELSDKLFEYFIVYGREKGEELEAEGG